MTTPTAFGIVGITQHEFKEKLGLTDKQMFDFGQAWLQREEQLTLLRRQAEQGEARSDRWYKAYRELLTASVGLLYEIRAAHGLPGKYALQREVQESEPPDPLLAAAFELQQLLDS